MKKAMLNLFGALVFSVVAAAQASAITIDFRNSAWNPGSGNDDITVGATTVSSSGNRSSLYWDGTNGFGVDSRNDETSQIEDGEGLNIAFSSYFTLTSFSINRLFGNEDGYVSFNGGAWQRFGGTDSGNRTVTLSTPIAVTSLSFGFPTSYNGGDAFYVESLRGDFQTPPAPPTVPEPTSMMLLGSGLLGLAARARRKKA